MDNLDQTIEESERKHSGAFYMIPAAAKMLAEKSVKLGRVHAKIDAIWLKISGVPDISRHTAGGITTSSLSRERVKKLQKS